MRFSFDKLLLGVRMPVKFNILEEKFISCSICKTQDGSSLHIKLNKYYRCCDYWPRFLDHYTVFAWSIVLPAFFCLVFTNVVKENGELYSTYSALALH